MKGRHPMVPGDPHASAAAITRKSGSNFAVAFGALDKGRRSAIETFYAFCRVVDDIADDAALPAAEKERGLDAWRDEIQRMYASDPQTGLGREMRRVVKAYGVEQRLLEEIVEGVSMDLRNTEYATWEHLRLYCHRVASCVGLVSIEIFGYEHPLTRKYAELLGLAFQTTNILRDVRADLEMGRVYFPEEDFARVGYSRAELRAGVVDERAMRMFRIMAERSEHYYGAAERALPDIDRPQMVAAQVMRGVYHGVLDRIRARRCDVWRHRVKLGKLAKVWLARAAWVAERGAPWVRPTQRVVVVGGGFAGLSAAVELSRGGHHVTLIESRRTLGGRAHSFRDGVTGDEVDNGQHVLMGCYRETLRFLDLIGAAHLLRPAGRMDVPYASEAKGITRLAVPQMLPGALGLGGALAGFGEMGWGEKARAGEVALSAWLDKSRSRWRASTASEWLAACGQSANAVRALWEPLCVAALNEPVATASADLFGEVIRRSLLGGSAASAILFSRVGLSGLFHKQARDVLEACGGCVATGVAAAEVLFNDRAAHAVRCASGERIVGDAFVLAVPWKPLRRMLPGECELAARLAGLEGAPIIGVHLWFDRPVTDLPFVGFLDSPIHWLFNTAALREDGGKPRAGHPVALVISAAYDLVETPQDQLVALALREMHRLLPSSRGAEVVHRFVYRAREATLRSVPELQGLRPGAATEWENVFLAGDWTDTGLPGTVESAVLSGRLAAEAFG